MISFVIPAYNEEKYLPATLAAIHEAARAAGEPYEIVVANDASTDRTAEIAEQAGARVVTVQKRQIAATRNAGAAAAAGDPLVFVDADTQVNADVVRGVLAALGDPSVAAGGAGVRFENVPGWVHWFMAVLVPFFRTMRWAAGCFLFCRRSAFDAAGGFDERYFAAEEIHMSRALGRHGRFVVLHETVVSSARKLEGHTALGMWWIMTKLVLRNPTGPRSREHAGFWYDVKR